jgi:dihydroneopterin aldolase
MRESELMMSGGLLALDSNGDGKALAKGERFSWSKRQVHGYTNTGSNDANILCMDRPAFIPSDEIEISKTEGSS